MKIDKFVSKLSDKGYAKDSAGQQFRIVKDKQRGNRSWRYMVNSKAGEVVSDASPSRDLAVVNALSQAVL